MDCLLLTRPPRGEAEVVALRLGHAASHSPAMLQLARSLGARSEALPARTVLQAENDAMRRPRWIVSGWAARYRLLSDGRRQIFDVVLPGEGVGVCLQPRPLAHASTTALTAVRLVDAGPMLQPETLDRVPELRVALQALADADERRMLDQIVRLGRLSALERLAHLLLDLRDRLDVIGQVQDDRFPMPLTQETLADIAGLSVVHVNRTMQELRRQKLLRIDRSSAHLLDPAELARIADRDGAAPREGRS